MKNSREIVVVGAGACGLMAARDLAKAGEKVVILEARNRVGGRIFPLSKKRFGYAAEGGAEFIHGKGRLTRSLAKQAGLAVSSTQGSVWRFEKGTLKQGEREIPGYPRVMKKLEALKTDLSVSVFLQRYFGDRKHAALRRRILNMVRGYDAADPARASSFTLREELRENGRGGGMIKIKEGYGKLTRYLADECLTAGVKVRLNSAVKSIRHGKVCSVQCRRGEVLEADRVIVTVPLPLIPTIAFRPAVPRKISAAKSVGFGSVIKVILRFRDFRWLYRKSAGLKDLTFLFSDGEFPTWWTEPSRPALTGWLGGPAARRLKGTPSARILAMAFRCLARIFDLRVAALKKECISATVLNWGADEFARGAYSYVAVGDGRARRELMKPVSGQLFFAGEALGNGTQASTVEGALADGRRVAKQVRLSLRRTRA